MSKESMRTIAPFFSTDRMVQEYSQRFYLPGVERICHERENRYARARELTRWKKLISERWPKVTLNLSAPLEGIEPEIGKEITLQAIVGLGEISPEHVSLELYIQNHALHAAGTQNLHLPMRLDTEMEKGVYRYTARFELPDSGRYGYKARIIPSHPELLNDYEMGLIRWA
jgi:starch phosphorylase